MIAQDLSTVGVLILRLDICATLKAQCTKNLDASVPLLQRMGTVTKPRWTFGPVQAPAATPSLHPLRETNRGKLWRCLDRPIPLPTAKALGQAKRCTALLGSAACHGAAAAQWTLTRYLGSGVGSQSSLQRKNGSGFLSTWLTMLSHGSDCFMAKKSCLTEVCDG